MVSFFSKTKTFSKRIRILRTGTGNRNQGHHGQLYECLCVRCGNHVEKKRLELTTTTLTREIKGALAKAQPVDELTHLVTGRCPKVVSKRSTFAREHSGLMQYDADHPRLRRR